MATKILLDTMKMADGGRVECSVAAPDGTVMHGVIETSFFEEFMVAGPVVAPAATRPVAVQDQRLMDARKLGRIVQQNLAYLEAEADKQWRAGSRELLIK